MVHQTSTCLKDYFKQVLYIDYILLEETSKSDLSIKDGSVKEDYLCIVCMFYVVVYFMYLHLYKHHKNKP